VGPFHTACYISETLLKQLRNRGGFEFQSGFEVQQPHKEILVNIKSKRNGVQNYSDTDDTILFVPILLYYFFLKQL